MKVDLFGNELPEKDVHGIWKIGGKSVNPMVAGYGPGPADKKCKHCAHCRVKRFSKNYFKCLLRPQSNGPATDIRVNWPACGKFIEANDKETG